MAENTLEIKSSIIIHGRLKKILDDKDLEEYFRAEYYKQLKECLDILDIDYAVTAVGLLGKALEKQLTEYVLKSIKSKKQFDINTQHHSAKEIREKLKGVTHFKRLELAIGRKITVKRGLEYKLIKKLLKDEDYQEMLNISRARNESFHDCSPERYSEIEAKAYTYIERGVVILAFLEKENRS